MAQDSDGNVLLHRVFIKRLRPKAITPRSYTGMFGGPARKGVLSSWQRRALKLYIAQEHCYERDIDEDEMLDTEVALENIPKNCTRWTSLSVSGSESFTAISSTMKPGNSTRCSSMVRYEM